MPHPRWQSLKRTYLEEGFNGRQGAAANAFESREKPLISRCPLSGGCASGGVFFWKFSAADALSSEGAFPAAIVLRKFSAADSGGLSECEWKIPVQIEHFVERAAERSCHEEVQAAEQEVSPLGEVDFEGIKAGGGGMLPAAEGKGYGEAADADVPLGTARLQKSADKALHHRIIGKCDGRVESEFVRGGEAPHPKSGQPPVSSCQLENGAVILENFECAQEHFRICDTCEQRPFPAVRLDDPVGAVEPDFAAQIDAVLTLPKFHQPCPAVVVKIDRKRVEDDTEVRGIPVIERLVAKFSLPCVEVGREQILAGQIRESERLDKRIECPAFFFAGHTADVVYQFLFAVVVQKNKKEGQEEDKRENHVHRAYSLLNR